MRKIALPGPHSPKLPRQLALGVPFPLAIVSSILAVFSAEIGKLPACLVTVGLIMGQGMLVNETATKFIDEKAKEVMNKSKCAPRVPVPAEQG